MLDRDINEKICGLVIDYKVIDCKDELTEEEYEKLNALREEIWSLLLGNI